MSHSSNTDTPEQSAPEIPQDFVNWADERAQTAAESLVIFSDQKVVYKAAHFAGSIAAHRHLGQPIPSLRLKEGDKVVLDKDFNNASVVILAKTAKYYSTVCDQMGDIWEVMTDRLSAIASREESLLPVQPEPSMGLKWVPCFYKEEFSNPIMTEATERPKDKYPVLVAVEGQYVFYVAWCKTWSDGAFWIIPGGTPESQARKIPFVVTHWCDCLPQYTTLSTPVQPSIEPDARLNDQK